MKIKIVIILMILLQSSIGLGQTAFVLQNLPVNNTYIYKQVGSQNYIQFNITNSFPYGFGANSLTINSITSNSTGAMSLIKPTFAINGLHFEFGNIISTLNNNSAKGNFIVSGMEIRSLHVYNANNNAYYNNVTITYNYDVADRALSLVKGDIVVDKLTIILQAANKNLNPLMNNTFDIDPENIFMLVGTFKVIYTPSDQFSATYKGQPVNAVNITEQYTDGFMRAYMLVTDGYGGKPVTILDNTSISKSTNIYTFVPSIGLPVYIQTSQFGTNALQKIQSLNDIIDNNINVELDTYSWNSSKTTDLQILLIIPIALFILIQKKKLKNKK